MQPLALAGQQDRRQRRGPGECFWPQLDYELLAKSYPRGQLVSSRLVALLANLQIVGCGGQA